jgi:hypothetical protein
MLAESDAGTSAFEHGRPTLCEVDPICWTGNGVS